MSPDVDSITIRILGREYQISCPASEEEALRKSARYLDKQMSVVKSRGSTLGFEKVAVMTALNMSHELLQASQSVSDSRNSSQLEIQHLEAKIDSVLQSSKQVEL